ncbi:MAG: hypothetical protein IJF83_11140 [Methanobrevibacter sp.]|nr:hypothetical protein [Methanobrevibacter sp.]
MCVIIYVPQGEQISKEELKKAWETNPDGAGYAIRKNGKVIYERGFMYFNMFFNKIKHLIGGYDIVLHFRISTSAEVNQLQTHPYEVGNKETLKGVTESPVVCMNGIISGQYEYKGYNDTMSYIKDHINSFYIIGKNNSDDLLNMIAENTNCKWAMITPEKVLISSNFTKHNGKYYSNKNHLKTSYYKSYCSINNTIKTPTLKSLCKTKKLYDELVKDRPLYYFLLDIIDIWQDHPYILEHIFSSTNPEEIEQIAYHYY